MIMKAMLSALLVICGLSGITFGLDSTLLAIRNGNSKLEKAERHLSSLLREAKVGNILLKRIIQVKIRFVCVSATTLTFCSGE